MVIKKDKCKISSEKGKALYLETFKCSLVPSSSCSFNFYVIYSINGTKLNK